MEWEQVGEIGVDAGLCWIGDPCYILHSKLPENQFGKDWHDFVNKLYDGDKDNPSIEETNTKQIGRGTGVVTSTGYGDGCYPVYVKKNAEGRVIAAKVVFSDEDGEEENW